MLTGQRPFEGRDVSEVVAGVLRLEPEWDRLPGDTPLHLNTLLKRCLEKELRQRVHDIADVRLAMEGAFGTTDSASSEPGAAPQLQVWQRPFPAAIAVLAALIVGGTGWGLVRPVPAPPETVTRFPLILPDGDAIGITDGMVLSPDGRMLVYAGRRDGVQQLFVRARDQTAVRPLPGTEEGRYPFFSPDGVWVGFFTPDSLKKVALAGGPPVTLCPVGNRAGATWGPGDTIVFASGDAPGLMQVPAAGGEPRPLTEPENQRHMWPTFVPGGSAILYTTTQRESVDPFAVAVVSLETGVQQTLIQGVAGSVTASGHLVFAREDVALGRPVRHRRADRLRGAGPGGRGRPGQLGRLGTLRDRRRWDPRLLTQ